MKKFFVALFTKKHSPQAYILFIFYCLGVIFFISLNLLIPANEQQFVLLAKAFLNGHLYLGPETISQDASYYHGHAFWPQGIFPAVVLLPFVFFLGNAMHQGNIQFVLNLLNIFLLYTIAFKITKNTVTSLWLAFAYIFATVYFVIGMFPWSWWYAQIVATSALLVLVAEYFGKRRFFIMGLAVACAMATRIDLGLALLFPLLTLLLEKKALSAKLPQFILLLLPIAVSLGVILLYNFFRFGAPLEFGYHYHVAAVGTAEKMLQKYGNWNLFYVPTNLYYLFIKGVDAVTVPGTSYLTFPYLRPDVWGMSIFLTSPIFLWCLKTARKEQVVKLAAVTALCILLFLLGYFGIGSRQYGYRYALDFSPFLYILLCFAFQQKMGRVAKIVIILSFLINLALFPSIFSQPLQ